MTPPSLTERAPPVGALVDPRDLRGDGVAAIVTGALSGRRQRVLPALLVLIAAVLWIDALRGVDLHAVGDLGLVSALPPTAFVALGIITASFGLTLRDKDVSTPLAVVHIVVLVLMLHGATSLIDGEPAFNVVWRHAGVTDYVLTTGRTNPHIDAYFNWPGFFFLAALATHAAGLSSTLGLSAWAPVVFELLCLPALVVIARAFTSDRRVSWGAVWVFYATNWVGQDYFSPQAMVFVMYLAVIAVVLSGLSRRAAPDLARWRERGVRLLVRLHVRRPGGELIEEVALPEVGSTQRAALVPVCVVIIAAIVASHQLTPWIMLASLVALVGLRRCIARGLPVITLALVLTWLTYLAAVYLHGHLKPLLGQTLDIQQTVSANVGGRLQGSADHLLVVRLRLAMTALVWGLAIVGAVRALRRGEASPSHAILAVAPVAVGVLQPYGGEIAMRVYLFSLPFVSCYAARALLPSATWRGWRVFATFACASALLLAGFVFTRWGNERMTLFTTAEVHAVDQLYRIAPKGSMLVAASPNLPWQFRHYGDYHYTLLSRQLKIPGPAPRPAHTAVAVARFMRHVRPVRAYLIITRSQKVYDQLLGAQLWGSAGQLERAVERSWRFRKVFDNGDGMIFTLSRRGARWRR
jgi:hypothetical protein